VVEAVRVAEDLDRVGSAVMVSVVQASAKRESSETLLLGKSVNRVVPALWESPLQVSRFQNREKTLKILPLSPE